jgi:chromosome segregation ATPase
VKLLPLTLRKYEDEYAEIHRLERERIEEVESLRNSNGQLQHQVRHLESNLAQLNQEHVSLANQMIHYKVEADRLKDENDGMLEELKELRERLAGHESKDMTDIEQQNAELLETKKRLESQLEHLERELLDTKQSQQEVSNTLSPFIQTVPCDTNKQLEDSNKVLKDRWDALRKNFESSLH